MGRSKHSGGDWVEMPADTKEKAGRTAKYDMRSLRSKHGDEAVQKNSPWHKKNAPAKKKSAKKDYMSVESKGGKRKKAKKRAGSTALGDKIDRMWEKI